MNAQLLICGKLRNGATGSLPDDQIGGSTFSFDVWPGHPCEDRVVSLLAAVRQQLGELWDEVTTHNRHEKPENVTRVTFYLGQFVKSEGPSEGA